MIDEKGRDYENRIIHARTASGSLYTFDFKNGMWTRSSDHEVVGLPGATGNRLRIFPSILIGQRILIESEDGTWISTSEVVDYWSEDINEHTLN